MAESTTPRIRLAAVSLDCADPEALADFYLALLGGERLWASDTSTGIRITGGLVLVPQRVAGYVAPTWPGTSIVHLDLTAGKTADETEAAARRAVGLGATMAEPQPDGRWRVMLDPAGHPFCITPFAPDENVDRAE